MTQDVIYPGECSLRLRRKCILLLLDGMFYKYHVVLSGLVCCLWLVFPC